MRPCPHETRATLTSVQGAISTITDAAGTMVDGQIYVPAGQAAQLIATLPAGTHRLFCSLYNGAHDRAGMHASLVVR
jgi:hypothetical protein